MADRAHYLRDNTRALLVGVSLLLIACSVTEVRQVRGLQAEPGLPAEQGQTVAIAPAVTHINPATVDRLVASVALLQLGYSHNELASWLQLRSDKTLSDHTNPPRLLPLLAANSPHADFVPLTHDVDQRQRLAMALPPLLSGSSPAFLL